MARKRPDLTRDFAAPPSAYQAEAVEALLITASSILPTAIEWMSP